MSELMRLYNTDLRSASDTLLDLGTIDFRWKNLYLSGTQSSNNLVTNSITTTVFFALGSSVQVGVKLTGMTVSTAVVSHLSATSAVVTSELFTKSVGSSLVLSNSARAYLNVRMLTHNVASPASGDVWFFASSNQVYLALISNNATYYVAMATG